MLSRLGSEWADASPNPLSRTLQDRRARGLAHLDLITANPHEHGLSFPIDRLAGMLSEVPAATLVYRPDPRGQVAARAAIVDYYARRDYPVAEENVLITPGTSLAYFYLFRVLLNPGDEVLIPWPGYPLFEDLARLAEARVRYYHLRNQAGSWSLDLEDVEFQCTARTRAVVLVSPHNPVGLVQRTWDDLSDVCRRRQLTLIVDEVFSEFLTDPQAVYPRPPLAAFPQLCLLNGVSKMFSLPGVKLGWMVCNQNALVSALEYVSDLFLPVSEWVQAAAPALLQSGESVARTLSDAYRVRRGILLRNLPTLGPADGGVYACLPLPESWDEDETVLQLLNCHNVLVHPGHFYNLPNHLVMTCVASPEVLSEGAQRIADFTASR